MKKIKDAAIEVREYILKSEALFNTGNLKEALHLAKKAVEIEPENASAHSNLGAIYHQLGHLRNSIFHSEKACRLFYSNNQYNKSSFLSYKKSIQKYHY